MVRLIKGKNDLATLNPALAKEWHPTENGNLKPEDVTPGSGKEVWWLCPEGHPYLMVVNHRGKRGYGCPYCSGHRGLKGVTIWPRRTPPWLKNGIMKKRRFNAARYNCWQQEKGMVAVRKGPRL